LISAMASVAHSETLTYGVDLGVGATDNVSLTPSNPSSQTIATADLDFTFKQQSQRFDAALRGDFSYLDFLQHAYGQELIGRFDGATSLGILPERLSWSLQDSFGQQQLSPFESPTPANLENVNYVSTGPDLTLHVGDNGFLDLSGRYARAQYQTSPFDNNRFLGNLAWGFALSPRSSVSLNGNFEHVLFENTALNSDFSQTSAYFDYDLHGARTQIVAKLGATELDQSGTTGSRSGPLIALELIRQLTPTSKLTVKTGQELTDAATSFNALESGAMGAIAIAPAALTSTTYTSTYAAASWDYSRDRTTLGVSVRVAKDSYDGQSLLDNSESSGELRFERKLTRVLSAEILGSVNYADYTHTNFTAFDKLVGTVLTVREGRGLEIRLRYNHVSRAATGTGAGFQENIGFLTIGYRPQ
jgi:hypothetical protein